jgi:CBS-domain-containing membrane protein
VEWKLGSQSLGSLNIIDKNVITVSGHSTLLDSMFLMHLHNVSSVGIVSGQRLDGVISMSDVKAVFQAADGYKTMKMTCIAFFKDLRQKQSFKHQGKDSLPVFTSSSETPLILAMVR